MVHAFWAHLIDFLKTNWLWLVVGLPLLILFILGIRLEGGGPVIRKVGDRPWVRRYLESRRARRMKVNLAGMALMAWFAKLFTLWIAPTVTPEMLFPPSVVGLQGVDLVRVRSGSIADRVKYTGTVRPYEETVVYARTSGFVRELRVYPGDGVRKRQVLITLETSLLDPVVKAAEADATFWKTEIHRDKALLDGGAITQSDYDRALDRYHSARAKEQL